MRLVKRSAAVAVGAALVSAVLSGPAAGEEEYEGDHSVIDAQVCLDTGGHLEGRICVGGPYTGYITR
ncbi:hypothetical protein [Nocardia sp. NPDC002869]|uniref:hypothetical protein n=1 Tax=Nocardia sp. NPDC002869 TaxID=3161032 RepID=UPI00398D1BD0